MLFNCNTKIQGLNGETEEGLCAISLKVAAQTVNRCTVLPFEWIRLFNLTLQASCKSSSPVSMVPVTEQYACPQFEETLAVCQFKPGLDGQAIYTTGKDFYNGYCPGLVDQLGCRTEEAWLGYQFMTEFAVIAAVTIIMCLCCCAYVRVTEACNEMMGKRELNTYKEIGNGDADYSDQFVEKNI